ncbi:LOW QUALITY PROTEIN: hypothetical protein MAR_002545 [Mya arenaria]|uniref:Uncharacterized protein n=1 Tax=Mya arenaria TaxID=6604 RepID=A0ABY7G6M3_MYAAR|nr:LOW QUALITY PROTEIN: hypothetical protein MAR_002545 [Mya arenaria]
MDTNILQAKTGMHLISEKLYMFSISRKLMADRRKIIEELTNRQLVDRYRFNRAGLNYLQTVLGPALEPATMRHKSLSFMSKPLFTLRYFATRLVHFPHTVRKLDAQVQQFYVVTRFSKVVGVINGTNIRTPSEYEPSYVNRKGFHFINVHVVFDGFDTDYCFYMFSCTYKLKKVS